MATGVPTDFSRLALALEGLQTAAQTTGPEGRLIFPGPGGSAQEALLREIDQTVLRRKLSFSNDQGHCLVLVVGERQVESGGSPGGSEVVRDVSGLRALLARFEAGSGRIWVRSELAGEGGFGATPGVSVQDLAAAQPSDSVADLCREISGLTDGIAIAVVVASRDARSAVSGAANWSKTLQALAQDVENLAPDQAAEAASPRLTIWHGISDDGISVARLCTAAFRIWIAFDPAHLCDVIAALKSRFSF